MARYAKWQAYFRLNPHPVLYPYVENTRLITYRGLTGAVFSLYTGLPEFHDMAFMLHTLTTEDTFVDVGANIGNYTILSAGVVSCRTLAVEPVPSTFQLLRQNVSLNQLDELVELHNLGIGESNGSLTFTNLLDTVNHVVTGQGADGIEVPVRRLDDIVSDVPVLIKIDVEGFEQAVLAGGKRVLQDEQLKAIIIELNGSGQRYGYADEDVHRTLTELGFNPFAYQPFTRTLVRMDSFGEHNTIYIRDLETIRNRVKSARKTKVLGQSF